MPSAQTQRDQLVGLVFPQHYLEALRLETPNQSLPRHCQSLLSQFSPSLPGPLPCFMCGKVAANGSPEYCKRKESRNTATIPDCQRTTLPIPRNSKSSRPSTQDDKLEKSFRSCFCGGGEGTYLLFFRPLTPASLSPLLAGAHKGARRPPWLSSPEARVSGPRPTRQNTQCFSGSRLTPEQVTSNKFETVGSFFTGDEEKVNNSSVTWNCFSRDAPVPQISMAFD